MSRTLVTGIDTGVGKTLVSAVMVAATGSDYWKPVQAGDRDGTDTDRVRALVPDARGTLHAERWRLREALSPHAAAQREGLRIDAASLTPPTTDNDLVIEGAGGVLVPLNERELLVDALAPLVSQVVLVSKNYLGSINHTLLSVEALERRGLAIRGLVFNGRSDPDSESLIEARTGLPILARVGELESVSPGAVRALAERWPA